MFRLLDVRNDLFGWLENTSTQSGECQRGSHQFQERTTLNWIVPGFSVLRIFTFDKLAKLGSVDHFFHTAPIAFGFLNVARGGLRGLVTVTIVQRSLVLLIQYVLAQQFEIDVTVVAH